MLIRCFIAFLSVASPVLVHGELMNDLKNIVYADASDHVEVSDPDTAKVTKALFFSGEVAFFKKDYGAAAKAYLSALEAYASSPGEIHEIDYSQMTWYFVEAAFLAHDYPAVVEIGEWMCTQIRIDYNIATLRLKIAEAKFELGDLDGSLADFAFHEKVWGNVTLLNSEDKKYKDFLVQNGIKA